MPALRPLWLDLGSISRRLQSARELQIGCDFDGTLTPIVSHPDRIEFTPRARDVVQRLASMPSVRLAVISGRSLHDLKARLQIPRAFLAGSGGLETQAPGAERRVHVPATHPLMELRPELEAWCRRHVGAWLEDKELALAVHYREMPPRFRAAFCAGVRRRLLPARGQIHVTAGKRVFELSPAVGWSKREAFGLWQETLGHHHHGALFFFGDDALDEPVQRHVRDMGGVSVAVGRRISKAFYWLADPAEVIWFLEWLEHEWRVLHGK